MQEMKTRIQEHDIKEKPRHRQGVLMTVQGGGCDQEAYLLGFGILEVAVNQECGSVRPRADAGAGVCDLKRSVFEPAK